MDRFEELKRMSLESLAEVTARYPWFGVAQKLLCERLSGLGGDGAGTAQYIEAAMHVASRGKVLSLLRKDSVAVRLPVEEKRPLPETGGTLSGESVREMHGSGFRGVGDYFSQAQYAKVKQSEDDSFRRFVSSDADVPVPEVESGFDMDFCTETLARIYAEQGYCQQAKEIYSKLILAYPEKNAYFATLIEKLGPEN